MQDHEIIEQAIALISRLMGEMEAEGFALEGFSDLSMRQMLYLETIAALNQPTFSELAEELKVTKPSVTAIIKKLIKMKYVKKVQSAQDLRVHHIVLDTKGTHFTELHDKIHRTLAQRLMRNLDAKEVHQMSLLLGKVIAP